MTTRTTTRRTRAQLPTAAATAPAAGRHADEDDEEDEDDDGSDDESVDESVTCSHSASACSSPPSPGGRPGAVAPPSAALESRIRSSARFPLSSFRGESFDPAVFVSDLTRGLSAIQDKEREKEKDKIERARAAQVAAAAAAAASATSPKTGAASRPKGAASALVVDDSENVDIAPPPFDPLGYHFLFDSALSRISLLRDEVESNIATLSAQAADANTEHAARMRHLNDELSGVFGRFRRLDQRIAKVSHTAVRIGHTLERVEQQKQASIQGQHLIRHFLLFNAGEPARLDPMFTNILANAAAGGGAAGPAGSGGTSPGGRDAAQLHAAAALIQQLSAISSDVRRERYRASHSADFSHQPDDRKLAATPLRERHSSARHCGDESVRGDAAAFPR